MADKIDHASMVPGPPGRVPGAECRIEALPNGVLLRAISFLDALQLVQTCVLSRRWCDLWRSVARINATRHEFDGMADSEEERDVLFKKFINAFLVLRNPVTLDEFRLTYFMPDHEESEDPDADSGDANLWLRHGLQSNARSVEVEIWDDRLHLDPAVFASKCFLTSLQLSCVMLFHGFFRNLQTGCTALERLLLTNCSVEDVEISSQTLNVLTIDHSSDFTYGERPSISIPSLSHLGFSASARITLLKDMGSLVTASVSVSSGGTQVDDIRQFLKSLSGVTNLELNYGGMLKMEKNLQWCPRFNNLTLLTLREWCLCADFYALTIFLQNSPNLMKLILKIRESPDALEKFIGDLEGSYFSSEHLEIVKIVCPENLEDDPVLNDLEKFLVRNGISPDQIEIKNWQ